ncbi:MULTISPECIES: hypothetical protein [Nostoc]|uniref:Uncharacterized protein n=2 Tax=Nostoc TaxID=1177 RepID=A0ABR8IK33_9NOSO|nr:MULTISPECIES: hypothetical protein [Nostoc]MBD2564731.1 hypothetical protein [Nostoc linckia FACHB-391]MBD2650865.1 hypothetical protein [Nostoc foliaceum FACHB-393]
MSEQVEQSEQQSQQNYFQAVGVISGQINFTEDKKLKIEIGRREYSIFSKPKPFEALKIHLKKKDTNEATLLVYPKVIHFPKPDQPHQIHFQLVAHQEAPSGLFEELNDGEFKLSGLWQFIPVCRTPCISIFKNFNFERLDFIKSAETSLKVKFMKASHLPIVWKDAIVPPFRFNPKVAKEDQAKRYFVQLKAKFNPEKNIFIFDSLMGLPTEELPNFLKASKTDKATVAAEKRKSNLNKKPGAKKESKTPLPKPIKKKAVLETE